MSKENNGGAAFPLTGAQMFNGQPIECIHQKGLTARDYFAAHSPFTMRDAVASMRAAGVTEYSGSDLASMLAAMNFVYADAMLQERAK